MTPVPDRVTQTQGACLYVVATPIGNLADISERAVQILSQVDLIACEDTRHTQKLLQHLGLRKPMISVHDHNESERIEQVRQHLSEGRSIALVSDAGTPLISDPGYVLVSALRSDGFTVTPVPGPSALITALSAAGLPTDRFLYEGFLPHKAGGRRERLEAVVNETATLVFYESRHRILDTLSIMAEVLGTDRPACVARELTKTFESFYTGTLPQLLSQLSEDDNHQKGEFVVMVSGNPEPVRAGSLDTERLLRLLLDELPPKKAAAVLAEMTGTGKKEWYQQALILQGKA
ncbi:MAG: 16S rRNA (cytidine(1402)-2'-O)-methyltransferase [Oceanospirillaceae bacterium]|nr:16S rRNA (cytidine(1402)-2'-O)-methyltransferase [Oceanospirillaceae bacterium]|tara:strand:- start:19036 stop:19908 length:873 start_codon:yes stop_codon:yes gene_type:complete